MLPSFCNKAISAKIHKTLKNAPTDNQIAGVKTSMNVFSERNFLQIKVINYLPIVRLHQVPAWSTPSQHTSHEEKLLYQSASVF